VPGGRPPQASLIASVLRMRYSGGRSARLRYPGLRGWSVLVLAPAAALVAALLSGETLLAHWTQTFMGAAGAFLAQFFPLFRAGAPTARATSTSSSPASSDRSSPSSR